MTIVASDLRETIRIETLSRSNTKGEITETWSTLSGATTVPAHIRYESESERVRGGRNEGKQSLIVTIRGEFDVDPSMRVVYDGAYWQVVGFPREIPGRRRFFRFPVVRTDVPTEDQETSATLGTLSANRSQGDEDDTFTFSITVTANDWTVDSVVVKDSTGATVATLTDGGGGAYSGGTTLDLGQHTLTAHVTNDLGVFKTSNSILALVTEDGGGGSTTPADIGTLSVDAANGSTSTSFTFSVTGVVANDWTIDRVELRYADGTVIGSMVDGGGGSYTLATTLTAGAQAVSAWVVSDAAETTASNGVSVIVDAPTSITSPSDGATDVALDATVTFAAVSGAEYDFQVASDSGFSTVVLEKFDLSTNSATLSGLSNNTTYYMRVRNRFSGWSATVSITTVAADTAATIGDLSVDANEGGVSTSFGFSATVVANDWTVSSVVVRDSADNLVATLSDSGGGVYTGSATLSAGAYALHAVVINDEASEVETDNSEPVIVYTAPSISSPADEATDVALGATISWNSITNGYYDLQIASDDGFTTIVQSEGGLTTNSAALKSALLSNSTTYYARVRNRYSDWSGTVEFTTVASTPAETPASLTDLSVDANVGGVSTSFGFSTTLTENDWTVTSVVVRDSADNLVATLSDSGGGVYTGSATLSAGAYALHAVAINDSAEEVETDNAEPVIVFAGTAITSPSDEATGVAIDATVTWNAVSGGIYDLQVATDDGFTSLVQESYDLTGTSQALNVSNGTTYYLRVRNQYSDWSSTIEIATVAADTPGTIGDISVDATVGGESTSFGFSVTVVANDWTISSVVVRDSGDNLIATLSDSGGGVYTGSGTLSAGSYAVHAVAINDEATEIESDNSEPILVFEGTSITSPADEATDVAVDATVTWNAVSGGIYDLQVATDSGFSSLVQESYDLSGTSQALNVSNGTTYYLRVRNQYSDWSATVEIATVAADTPGTIGDLSVDAFVGGESTSFGFSVTVVANDWTISSVVVRDSGDNLIATLSDSGGGVYTGSATIAAGEYALHAVAINDEATEIESDNSEPVLVFEGTSITSPSDEATDVAIDATVTWGAVSGGIYDLQVATDDGFSSLVQESYDLSGTSQALNVSNGTTYYLRVRNQHSDWSSTVEIATVAADTPVTIGTLSVDAVEGGEATTFGFSVTVVANDWTITSVVVRDSDDTLLATLSDSGGGVYTGSTTLSAGTYAVHAVAINDEAAEIESANSEPIVVYEAPSISSPSDEATDIALDATIAWNAITGGYYDMQVATDDGFVTIVQSEGGLTTNSADLKEALLANETTYYVRVRNRYSDWSGTIEFTTVAAASETPASVGDLSVDATVGGVSTSFGFSVTVTANDWTLTSVVVRDSDDNLVDTLSDSGGGVYTGSATLSVGAYALHAVAINDSAEEAESDNSEPVVVYEAPSISSPADEATGVALDATVTWNSISGGDYDFQVSSDSGFSTIVQSEGALSTNSVDLKEALLSSSTTYYLRVRNHYSDWSGTIEIETAAADTTAPSLSAGSTVSAESYTGCDIATTWDEAGDLYLLVVPDGSTAPTKAQIKAQTDYGAVTIADAITDIVAAAAERIVTPSVSPDDATTYDYYMFVEDATGNQSDIESGEFTTRQIPRVVVGAQDGYLECSGVPLEPNDQNAFLVMAEVYVNDFGEQYKNIIDYGYSSGDSEGWVLRTGNSFQLWIQANGNTGNHYFKTDAPLRVAIHKFDNAGKIRLYVNGCYIDDVNKYSNDISANDRIRIFAPGTAGCLSALRNLVVLSYPVSTANSVLEDDYEIFFNAAHPLTLSDILGDFTGTEEMMVPFDELGTVGAAQTRYDLTANNKDFTDNLDSSDYVASAPITDYLVP